MNFKESILVGNATPSHSLLSTSEKRKCICSQEWNKTSKTSTMLNIHKVAMLKACKT
ncbi:MAG: hypothetical protein QXZ02_00520 [Candidatus Bathyarchaeia archaeon]